MQQQSKRDRHQSLLNDRQSKADKLESLRAQQSAALIDGTEFSLSADIRVLSDDIHALDAAIVVASDAADDEERRHSAASNAERRQTELEQIDADAARYLEVVRNVQSAIASAVAGLSEMYALATKMEIVALPASGERAISALIHQNIGIRMSQRIARAFSPLDPASIGAFGIFRWPPERPDPKEDWVAGERVQLDGFIPHVKRKSNEYIAEQTAIADEE